VADDLSAKRLRAQRDNYATDENINRRASLLSHALPPKTRQPKLEDFFDWPSYATVLDIGCGNGRWTSAAAVKTLDGTVIGLDNSIGMLAALRKRSSSVFAILGDAHRLPIRSASVDAVIAAWVLYHLRDKPAALSEIKRVLQPSGRFIAKARVR
jgi:ubiquinone/menaquinone biosynthesis C-methylase UbiE